MQDHTCTQATAQLIERGLEQLNAGHYKSVHQDCISMIQHSVTDPVPYLLLGKLASDHGNHKKALELHQKAAELAPASAYCQTYLAQALVQLGHQTQAKKTADIAAKLPPESAHQTDTLGVVYSRTGFHENAVPWFEDAVKADPASANYHFNLGASLQFIGEFDAAEKAYHATLKREPNAYRALSSIIGLSKQTADNQQLELLLDMFERMQSDADAALHLGHALAKTYEDLGDYEQSLDWLHKAKAKKHKVNGMVDYSSIFAAAQTTASNINVPRHQPSNQALEAPIFIIGLPRTGTTLVDRIISSHPSVVAAGELNTFANLVKTAADTPSNLTMDAQTLIAGSSIDLASIGQQYLTSLTDLRRSADRVTDKMPLNFFYAGLIHKALPNARIIALRRGAMDSCLSNYRQLLSVQHSYYNYTYDLSATAEFYKGFDQLMRHWREHLPSNRFTEVYYEDIVHDQENQTRRLLNFCGLTWDDACMRFHENAAPVSTASSVQVRQPLYSGSIGRWQRYGDKLDALKTALGELAG